MMRKRRIPRGVSHCGEISNKAGTSNGVELLTSTKTGRKKSRTKTTGAQAVLVLVEDVSRLGWRGEIIEVTSGYARNYLLPKGLAVVASEAPAALVNALAKERARRVEQMERERRGLLELAAAVDGAEVVFARAANEQGRLFGSVTSSDIVTSLAEQGFEVAADAVQLAEHTCGRAIKQVGTHSVNLKFASVLPASYLRLSPKAGKKAAGRTKDEEARLPSVRTHQEDGQDLTRRGGLTATVSVVVVAKEKDESEPVDQSR